MSEKVVGELSNEEFREIEDLFERKLALENITKIIDVEDNKLYEKLIKDYGETVRKFKNWWNVMSKKYNWEGTNWRVDFETKQILTND